MPKSKFIETDYDASGVNTSQLGNLVFFPASVSNSEVNLK
jgi:hypothetical protein